MKRLFVLFAFLLVSGAAFAQDEKPQSEGTLLIVPRLDAEPAYYFGDKAWSFGFGSTSLYTFFDGNVGDHFSFSFGNHWFALSDSFDNTLDLYRNTWRTDVTNWVDWATVTGSFAGFFLTLGKDYMHFATFENDAYDYLSHWQINSALWNNYQVYQWGGRFGWMTEDESTIVSVEVTNDQSRDGSPKRPFSGRSFDDYAFTLFASHDFESVQLMGSVSQCTLDWMGALGLGVNFTDDLVLNLDGYFGRRFGGASARFDAGLCEHFDLFAKAGFDKGSKPLVIDGTRFYGGVGAYWYPLRENRDLRVHALCSYDSLENSLAMSFGILYQLNLKIY